MDREPQRRDPPKKRRRAKRRARRQAEDFVHYELQVGDWDYFYGFGIGDPKSPFTRGFYDEIATLSLTGPMVSPEGLRYTKGALTLSARAGLLTERRETPPQSIGSLSAREETLSAYVFVPVERLSELVNVALSGRLRLASITGTRLRYRSGTIRGFHLTTELDDEDFA